MSRTEYLHKTEILWDEFRTRLGDFDSRIESTAGSIELARVRILDERIRLETRIGQLRTAPDDEW